MKTKVVFLLCMFLSIIAFSQNENQKFLMEITVVPPSFPIVKSTIQGKNIESLDDFLKFNVTYPSRAFNIGYEGTEVVQFIVTPSGGLTSFNVINSVSSDIDEEVIRILDLTSGKWKPGSVDGEPVAMVKEVSVVFKRFETTDFVPLARKYSTQGYNMLFVEKNPRKAMRYFEKGITLLPNEENLLLARSMCKYELGDKEGALMDWNRANRLLKTENHSFEPAFLTYDLSNLKGYKEMMLLTQKQ